MAIDVHAHYVPPSLFPVLQKKGKDLGIDLIETEPNCHCVHFHYGLKCRPFFTRLVESPQERMDSMDNTGIDRQILSGWVDVFGHGLSTTQGQAWHRLLNESMSSFCAQNPKRFSFMASGHTPDAALAAQELEYAVQKLGAVGGVLACNVEGVNLGELHLDDYWATAQALNVPIFLHPTQPQPTSRSAKFALNQVVQYTFDTTLAVGSVMWAGVLDRFPKLQLILSHAGGALPYLMGRFDLMHGKSNPHHTGITALKKPSEYMSDMHYDTITHDPQALNYLKEKVGISQILLGSDDSFPPADVNPLQSLKRADFNAAEIEQIANTNPRRLFKSLA